MSNLLSLGLRCRVMTASPVSGAVFWPRMKYL